MVDQRENSQNTGEEAEGREQARPRKGIPMMVKIATGVVAVLMISLFAFFLVRGFLLPKYQVYRTERQLVNAEKESKVAISEIGLVHVIEDLTVNTLGAGGRRFVVVEYVIESTDKNVIEEVKRREPQLRDTFIRFLRNHTTDEILGLEFQEQSKTALMTLINNHIRSGIIDSLYYTKLIVQ